ncbi:MAG: hypothetical protein U5K54_02920 [Cytophagales bacterium]|nr:hypothetical protein [Cytophagales bacterium]
MTEKRTTTANTLVIVWSKYSLQGSPDPLPEEKVKINSKIAWSVDQQ